MVTRMMIAPDTTRTYVPNDGAAGTNLANLPDVLGSVRWSADGKKAYRLVQVVDLALVVGDLVCFSTANDNKHVTSDRAGGTSENTRVAGLAIVACAVGSCCWIQVAGLSEAAIVTDGSVAAGEAIIAHATTDGGADSSTGSSTKSPWDEFGQVMDDDTGTALAAALLLLACPITSG